MDSVFVDHSLQYRPLQRGGGKKTRKKGKRKKNLPPGVIEESAIPERMLSSFSAVEKT